MPHQKVNPGPINDSLLSMQSIHVSEHIWNGQPNRVLRIRRATKSGHRDGSIPNEVRPFLARAGMLGVAEMSYFPIDHHLISALVERWRPETHTFHMTFGECTITLEDVSILFGLKVHGDPITGCSTYRWVSLIEDLLGIIPPTNAIKGGRLKMSWVDQYFSDVSMHVHSVQQMERYARAYILRLLGGMLFSDKSSTLVPLRYLVMLTDLDRCGQLSWGSAVLADLYRELCVATNYDHKEISGACVLLQLWAWYRMPYFAPLTRPLNTVGVPLGARWNSALHVPREEQKKTIVQIRDALDKMKDKDFVWQPYFQYFYSLPSYCVENTNIWRASVPLINFHIIEYHHPDRVMRQFGMVQHIPRPPRQPDNLHDLTLRGKDDIDWRVQHAIFVHEWETRLDRVWTQDSCTTTHLSSNSEYMVWYKRHTRRWIGHITAKQGYVEDIIEEMYHKAKTEPRSSFSMKELTDNLANCLEVFGEFHRLQYPSTGAPTPSQDESKPVVVENIGAGRQEGRGLGRRRRHVEHESIEVFVPSHDPPAGTYYAYPVTPSGGFNSYVYTSGDTSVETPSSGANVSFLLDTHLPPSSGC